jgi:hypothetical protein
MPFGCHKGELLSGIPSDYLDWLLRNVRIGRGLRAAIADELCRRGLSAPSAPPPWPLPTCSRCPGVKPQLSWLQDSLGRRRIRIECGRCHQSMGFAETREPYTTEADAAASKTPVLDVLTKLEDLGVELRSDGKHVRFARDGDYRRVPPDLRRMLKQCQNDLARMIGRTSP